MNLSERLVFLGVEGKGGTHSINPASWMKWTPHHHHLHPLHPLHHLPLLPSPLTGGVSGLEAAESRLRESRTHRSAPEKLRRRRQPAAEPRSHDEDGGTERK